MDAIQDQFVFSAGTTQHNDISFAPINLQFTRPQRAWERKPTSPFSSRNTHKKKIWKRVVTKSSSTNHVLDNSLPTEKAIKRRCISSEQAISTQVEALASPEKRITTRSSAFKDLVELDEEDPSEADVEGTIIEIVNEDGTLTDITETLDEADAWHDEEEYDDTLMHLEDAITHVTAPSIAKVEPAAQIAALPAGFVSPVWRNSSVNKRLQSSSRRRTLPNTFAPVFQLPSNPNAQHAEEPSKTATVAQDEGLADDQLSTNDDLPQQLQSEEPVAPPADLQPPVSPPRKLRRSPRRKSSSPVKAKQPAAKHSTAHLIAFTPIKRRAASPEVTPLAQGSPVPTQSPLVPQTPPTPAGVSIDAKRGDKTRLSDDTALLQAFLDRAAQSKNASKQTPSSPTHEIVPASPQTGALAELDPNLPSPHKTASPQVRLRIRHADTEEIVCATKDENDELQGPPVRSSKEIRRSGRAPTAAPAKITLRGLQDNLIQKRTPQQELFLLTGRNTRANKADAVHPSVRVPALMAEMLEMSGKQPPRKKSAKAKTVSWDKTPVVFEIAADAPDADEDMPFEGLAAADEELIYLPLVTNDHELIEASIEQQTRLERQPTPARPRPQIKAPRSRIVSAAAKPEVKSQVPRRSFKSNIATPMKRSALPRPEARGLSEISGNARISKPALGLKGKLQSRLPASKIETDTTLTLSTSAQSEPVALLASPPKRKVSLFAPQMGTASKLDLGTKIERPSLSSPAKKRVRRVM